MTTSDGSTFARSAVSAIAAATAGLVRRSSGSSALPPDGEGVAVTPGLVPVAAGVVGVGEPEGWLAVSPSLENAHALVDRSTMLSVRAKRYGVRIGTPARRGHQYLEERRGGGVPTARGARAS